MRKHLQFHECNSTVELNACNKFSKQGKIMGSELSRYCYTYNSAYKKVFNRQSTNSWVMVEQFYSAAKRCVLNTFPNCSFIDIYHKKQSIWEAMNSKVKDHRLLLRKEYRCLCTYNSKIHILPDETLYRLVTPRRTNTSSSKVVKVHDFGQGSLPNEMIFLPHFFSFLLFSMCMCVCV